jgi:RNA polymerase sigma-70 factor (ECF subfamily)
VVKLRTSEEQLVQLCLAGDTKAQYELYNRYVDAMYNTAVRIVARRAEAEDVLQESFAKVFQQLHTFRSDATIGAWIKKIVVTTALSHLRKHRKARIIELDAVGEPSIEKEDQELPIDPKTIHRAIKKLPEGSRVVFNLYLLEGLQHKEIAEVLDISESTSKTQYRRAKQLLREELGKLEDGKIGGLED